MDWTVPVNDMLKDDITKLNYTLIPPGFQGDVRSVRVMQDSLSKLIDALGEESAAAQGLNKIITTAEKLRNSAAHFLYLLKDAAANSGRGEVIGLLKVGRKHLFLFDERGRLREVEPLCVLDFYVERSRRRLGHGRRLFDYMLQDSQVRVQEMAVDGPSVKMERFLASNYGVTQLLRQNNNFAVSPDFFDSAEDVRGSGASTPSAPATHGRFAAHQPPSAIGNVIHGGGGSSYFRDADNGRVTPSRSPSPPCDSAPPPERPCTLSVAPQPAVSLAAAVSQTAPTAQTAPVPQPESAPQRASVLQTPLVPQTPLIHQSGAVTPASAGSRRDSQLTERGFFDVKFYHNKLW